MALVLMVSLPGQALGNGFLDGMLSTGWEENLSRGFLAPDREGSSFLSATATAGKLYQPLVNTSLVVSASGAYHRYVKQSKFSRLDLGAAISLTQKFGLGPYSPRLSVGLSGNREWLSGAERDRDLYNLEVTLSKRLNTRWELTLGVAEENSRGLNERPWISPSCPISPASPGPRIPWTITTMSTSAASIMSLTMAGC
jgi:hypothetical protein